MRTADGVEHELDVLVFATGFDAVDGNYAVDGPAGPRRESTSTSTGPTGPPATSASPPAGFPNMFMILGPNGPFTNLPPSIEAQVEFITDDDLHRSRPPRPAGSTSSPTTETDWTEDLRARSPHMTLFPKVDSWIFGANIPGKKNTVMFYMGGIGDYRKIVAAEKTAGYPSFTLGPPHSRSGHPA